MGSRLLAVKGGGREKRSGMEHQTQTLLLVLVASLFLSLHRAEAQFSSSSRQGTRVGKTIIIPLPKDASGTDVYPDCNKGKVCLPEAQHCSTRQQKIGALQYNPNPRQANKTKTYWVSWHSNEQVLRDARWNWFSARNYCRKRCMDLVSFENEGEWSLFKGFMEKAGVKEIWTAGRLCDAEVTGCDAEHYFPKNINGWFWASTVTKMLPTNRPVGINPDGVRVIGVNEWAPGQPSGPILDNGFGAEPCMAVIDGKWHDTPCQDKRQIVCEDLPDRNIKFVRDNNPRVFIP